MPDTEVTVHVNRESADGLETAASAVEVEGSFALRLAGHDAPAHVHCRLGGDLERIASLAEGNYYVEPDAVTTVPVGVDADAIDEPVEGNLEVVAGYGAETASIAVTVVPGPPAVDVDDSLAEPADTGPESTESGRILDRIAGVGGLEPATLAVAALGLVAIGVGGATAATIGGPVTAAGLVIVLVGVAVALLLLVQ